MNHKIIKELNTFLEGNYMAIHAYENYIHHINDESLKQVLQSIQQDHKQHATMIAERIQNLGGISVDDVGIMGNIVEMINKIKGTNEKISILKDALVGEQRGIKKSKALLEGDLDPESLAIVKQILNEDEKHVELIDSLLKG